MAESATSIADSNREQSLATFGLLGASFALLLAILTLEHLDTPLRVSVAALTVALPLLALDAWSVTQFSFDQREKMWWPTFVPMLSGYVGGVTAIAAAFWHVHWLYGAGFVILCAIAMILGTHVNILRERLRL